MKNIHEHIKHMASREEELMSFAKSGLNPPSFFILTIIHCMKPFDMEAGVMRDILSIFIKNEELLNAHINFPHPQ